MLKAPNNKSQDRMSKKKKDSIRTKQQKESEQHSKKVSSSKNEHPQSDSPKEPFVLNTVPKINKEYGVINSKDEYDHDTHSMEENDDDEEKTSEYLIKAFESTINSDFQQEVHEVTWKQGPPPSGRKEEKVCSKSTYISTSTNSSRPTLDPKADVFNN